MKPPRLFVLCTTVCSLLATPLPGLMAADTSAKTAATLKKDSARLYLPPQPAGPLRLAHEELAAYHRKITGRELPVAQGEAESKTTTGFRFIVREEAAWKGKESAQAFVIEETAEGAFTGVTITGNTGIAVLYGVYQYLEGLGVRWFTPGELGENVPRMDAIPLHPGRRAFTPSFLERGLDFSGVARDHFDTTDPAHYENVTRHDYALWRLRNRLMFQRSINKGIAFDFNHVSQASGHAILPAVLGPSGKEREALFAKEPERFPLFTKDGVRARHASGGQICFTNTKNHEQAVASAVAFFERQAATRAERNTDLDEVMDTFPMGLSDAHGICECNACERVAGEGQWRRDRLVWTFYNGVARELNRRMPGRKIGLYAPYLDLRRPPEDFRIEPNLVAVAARPLAWSAAEEDRPFYPFTRYARENTDATRVAGAEIRTYTYSPWLGSPQMMSLLDTAQTLQAEGIRYFHTEVMTRHEQMWPFLWTLAQYTWNSERPTAERLAQFCREYYGADAGETVLDLLRELDAGGRALPRVVYGGFSDTQQIMTPERTEKGRARLAAALLKATGKEKERLERFRDTWELFARTGEVYLRYAEALDERKPEALARFRQAREEYERFWKESTLNATASPRTLARVTALDPAAPPSKPAGQPELSERAAWLAALYAPAVPPKETGGIHPLPEDWKFRIDPLDTGLANGWEKPAFEDNAWRTLSTWAPFEGQGNKSVDGRFWYRVSFDAPPMAKGGKVFLRFGGLDEDGEIYLNGQLAYTRRHLQPDDWQTSFAFDATALLRPGEKNVIAVRGYDSTGAGGIWRPVALEIQ
jgi:hypothetical protein